MNIYLIFLIIYTFFTSIVDFYTNKFYSKVWEKKTTKEKGLLIFYLIFHNILYYLIYFTLFFILYYYKSINIKYLIYYLILLIIIPIHWKTNNNRCWFTVQQNKLLEIDEDYGFRDLYLIFTNTHVNTSKSSLRNKLYYYYIFFSIIITTLLIIFKNI